MASRKEEKEARRTARLEAERAAEADARRRKLFAGLGAAALAAIVVVIALILLSQSGEEDGSVGAISGVGEVDTELAGIPQRGTLLGEPGSDVRIVEYGDLQCPACAEFSRTVVPDVISGPVRDGDARLEFRNFNIIGPDSEVAARAALAAAEQDRYWQFVELFYRNQGAENSGYVTDELLTDIAIAAGVEDIDAWQQAREEGGWDERFAETRDQAITLGIQATPSVVVEGPGGTENLGSFPSAEQIEEAVAEVG